MKPTHAFALAFFASCAIVPLAATASAAGQILAASPAASSFARWNSADEITITGSIVSLVTAHSADIPSGSTILIGSAQGDFYVNLGPHPGAPLMKLLTEGQFVNLTGILRNFNGQNCLIARTLSINGQIYILRNANGMPNNNVSWTRLSARTRQGSFGGSR